MHIRIVSTPQNLEYICDAEMNELSVIGLLTVFPKKNQTEKEMPENKRKPSDETTELIRTMIIVQLGLAGIPQQNIRSIAGCDMNRVSNILKQLTTKKKSKKKEEG